MDTDTKIRVCYIILVISCLVSSICFIFTEDRLSQLINILTIVIDISFIICSVTIPAYLEGLIES